MVAQCISELDILFNPPDPLFKGAIRAYGLSIAAMPSLPASFGPASDDALVTLWTVLLRLPSPEKVYVTAEALTGVRGNNGFC